MFEKVLQWDLLCWNTIIASYVQDGHCNDTYKLFHQMSQIEKKPDLVIIITIVLACACLGDVKKV